MKQRGTAHTTLTETAREVVSVLKKTPGVKMIAPGEIKTGARRRSGDKYVTLVHTTAGLEMIISGQSVQNVAVHFDNEVAKKHALTFLTTHKKLSAFSFKTRERKPGV